jgi:hypothetical protein
MINFGSNKDFFLHPQPISPPLEKDDTFSRQFSTKFKKFRDKNFYKIPFPKFCIPNLIDVLDLFSYAKLNGIS